jgi:hypothetical protein
LTYSRNLTLDEIIFDWMCEMENLLKFEGLENTRRVRFACTNMKGHAFLWWDKLQLNQEAKGKEKI